MVIGRKKGKIEGISNFWILGNIETIEFGDGESMEVGNICTTSGDTQYISMAICSKNICIFAKTKI